MSGTSGEASSGLTHSVASVRAAVAELIGEDPEFIGEDENLIELGLDSIRMMKLAGRWRSEGVEVSFAELAEQPTVRSWVELLAERAPAALASPSASSPAPTDSADAPGTAGDTAGTAGAGSTASAADIAADNAADVADASSAAEASGAEAAGGAAEGHSAAPSAAAAGGPSGAVDPNAPFDLALMQHAYWIGRGEGQHLGSVAAHLYVEFDGSGVDPDRLEQAVAKLIDRHGMLRAAFTDDGRARILPERGHPAIIRNDFSALAPEAVEQELARLRDELTHQLMPVEEGKVIDVRLSLLPGGRTRLHVDVDMLAADAVSYRMMLADLARLYEAPDAQLPPIGYSFPEYLAARRSEPPTTAERDRRWWVERVPELPGPPDLPMVPETERVDPYRVVRYNHWVSPEQREALFRRAHAHGITPAMAFATVFAEVLGRWSGTPKFLLNLPLFDREPCHPDVGLLVGDFTSSVLLSVDLTEPASFLERARALQAELHTAGAHSSYSGVEVLRDLSRHRGEQVLAPVVYTSALNLGELFDEAVGRLFGEPVWIISQGPQVVLDAQLTELRGGLLANWDVRRSAFPPGVVDAMFAAYRGIIDALAAPEADWNAPLAIDLPADQAAVRARVNDTAVAADPAGVGQLHQRFFEQAKRRPDAPAVIWGLGDGPDGRQSGRPSGELTYGELADTALRVAAALVDSGVRPGDAVAVELPKGPDQVVAVLGVLAAGGVYVPVAVDQPPARRERIHARAGIRAILGETELASARRYRTPLDAPVVTSPEDVAYVLFTSGSTGEPKGVEVPHRAALNTIDDLNRRFGVGPGDRSLNLSALEFDLSVYDIFGMLAAGGAVVVISEDDRRDAAAWVELLRRRRVTLLNCVPALLDMGLTAAGPAGFGEHLRVVLLGGDWVGVDLPGRLAQAAPQCRFVALGGTTETAIHSTVQEVVDGKVPANWRAVPYGTPLANVACRVVDPLGRDCPDWVAGELWIGGDGVARGYRGDPERTADRFVTYQGRRWYRTGDMARYWPDGCIEFLGRRDDQVKIRGFRIELGEVEAALTRHPQVDRALADVVGAGGPAGAGGGGRRLVAAVASGAAGAGGSGLAGEEVIEFARTQLPPHMVPELVLVLPAFPLTPNGKVNRRALREQLAAAGGTGPAYTAPSSPLEQVVADVAGEVLGAERVGADDDFFALGGDSVLATRFITRLREALDHPGIGVRMVFAERTPRAIAAALRAGEETPGLLDQIAEVYLEVAALSPEDVEARLAGR